MLELAEVTKETVSIHTVSGRNRVCIDAIATAASPLRNVVQPGEQVPLLAGSASKVLMAHMPKSSLTHIVSAIARQTKRSQAQVLDELARIRRQGYAVSHGERLLGVSAVSAPITDAQDEVHYCLSIGGPTVRMQTNEQELVRRAQEGRDRHLPTIRGKSGLIADMLLANKIAVITGNPYGIGRESAALFTREGAHVICVDDTAEGWAADGPAKAGQPDFVADVASAEGVAAVVAQCEAAGRVDILFNLAGRATKQRFETTTEETWKQMLARNLTAAFICSQQFLPLMKKSSSAVIINHASIDAFLGNPSIAAYSAAKGGVLPLTHVMAHDLASTEYASTAYPPVEFVMEAIALGMLRACALRHLAAPAHRRMSHALRCFLRLSSPLTSTERISLSTAVERRLHKDATRTDQLPGSKRTSISSAGSHTVGPSAVYMQRLSRDETCFIRHQE